MVQRRLSVFVVVLGLLLMLLPIVHASDIEDLMKKEKITLQQLKETLPKIANKLGEKTKSQVCQDQLKGLEAFVDKGAVELLSSREAAVEALCTISKFCISETIAALRKLIVGGEQKLMEMLNQYSGGLTAGMDIETLGLMYYDLMCKKAGGKEKNRVDL